VVGSYIVSHENARDRLFGDVAWSRIVASALLANQLRIRVGAKIRIGIELCDVRWDRFGEGGADPAPSLT